MAGTSGKPTSSATFNSATATNAALLAMPVPPALQWEVEDEVEILLTSAADDADDEEEVEGGGNNMGDGSRWVLLVKAFIFCVLYILFCRSS